VSNQLRNVRSAGRIPSPGTWWGPQPPQGDPMSIAALIRAGTLDAELAGLLWLLVEARLPVVVAAGPRLAGKTTVLTALLEFLPPTVEVVALRGWSEDFAWLPEAGQLGWHGITTDRIGDEEAAPPTGHVSPTTTYLVANEVSPHLPMYTWGEAARLAVRATSIGYGLGATLHADSLEDVFAELRGPDVRLTDDELSHLGVVLVLGTGRGRDGRLLRRVQAAHYIRPIARDVHGHVQRMNPAVLATWNASTDSFEHFAWGVATELADRVGRAARDFNSEHARRTDLLNGLVAAGVEDIDTVRAAIETYRTPAGAHRH